MMVDEPNRKYKLYQFVKTVPHKIRREAET